MRPEPESQTPARPDTLAADQVFAAPVAARGFDLERLPEPLRSDLRADPAIALALRSRALPVEDFLGAGQQATPQADKVCAFFDLDGTLLHGSIVGQLVIQAVQEKRLRWWTYLGFIFFFLLYKLNLIPRQRMYRWGYGLGAGVSLESSLDYVRRGVDEMVVPRIYAGAKDLIDKHRAQGHKVVAVTGAPDYAAARVAVALGLDDILATPTPVDGELMGAELTGPLCYGEGKVHYAQAYAKVHDVDLRACYFYSDSRSDLPLLNQVEHPVCVNPQLLLRLVAWRRGWPIIRL